MKIQDLHRIVVENLQSFADLDPSSVIYTKSPTEGDFTIHKSRLNLSNNTTINDILTGLKSDYISKIILRGSSLVIYIDHRKYLKKLLTDIVTLKDDYGKGPQKDKLIIVEYSSPNIAKKFHAGHLRTTVLGSFVSNLLESLGYRTYNINYLGDWGKQFGLIGVGFKKYGCEKALKLDAIRHLFDVYVKICNDAREDQLVDNEAREWFKDLENGDKKNAQFYQMCRETSIERYKELYEVLNCRFDEFSGESLYAHQAKDIIEKYSKVLDSASVAVTDGSKVQSGSDRLNDDFGKLSVGALQTVQTGSEYHSNNHGTDIGARSDRISEEPYIVPQDNENIDHDPVLDTMDVKRGVYTIQKPAKTLQSKKPPTKAEPHVNDPYIVKLDQDGSKFIETTYGNVCVIKQDGATLYSSRDIAACFDRVNRLKPDGIIYVVASQQDLYFKQLFEIFKKTKLNKSTSFKHINFGLVDGMSTRKGTVVFLEDIINEAKETMLTKMNENLSKSELIENKDNTCEILAASAIIVQDFGAKRIKNYTFDMDRNTSTTGFTGPYLQYLHCRLVSIENRNADKTERLDELIESGKFFEVFSEDDFDDKMIESFVNLAKFNLILERCVVNYEPSTLLTYLMDTAKNMHGLIRDYKVLGVDDKLAIPRLMFYRANRIVLANGMRVLGLKPLSRM